MHDVHVLTGGYDYSAGTRVAVMRWPYAHTTNTGKWPRGIKLCLTTVVGSITLLWVLGFAAPFDCSRTWRQPMTVPLLHTDHLTVTTHQSDPRHDHPQWPRRWAKILREMGDFDPDAYKNCKPSVEITRSALALPTERYGGMHILKCTYRDCPAAYSVPRLPFHIPPGCLVSSSLGDVRVPGIAKNYIDTVGRGVLGSWCQSEYAAVDGSGHDHATGPCHVMTMVGLRRLRNVQSLVEDTILNNIPGDFIEAGAWRGGLCAFVAGIYASYGQTGSRLVWVADSFKGIPKSKHPIDLHDHRSRIAHKIDILNNNNLVNVKWDFHRLGLLNENLVRFIPGYFQDSFPVFRQEWTSFSVVRVDGDTYESVYYSLRVLYPFLSPGGFVIVDDYTDWAPARKATADFLSEHAPHTQIIPVWHKAHEAPRGVWFRKALE